MMTRLALLALAVVRLPRRRPPVESQGVTDRKGSI
jgi:hypothetical protein